MPTIDAKNLPEFLTVGYTILSWLGRAIRAAVTLLHNNPQKFEVDIGPKTAETIEKVTAMITSQHHDVPASVGQSALLLYLSDPDKMADCVALGLSDAELGFHVISRLPADVRIRINHLLAAAMDAIEVELSKHAPSDAERIVDSDTVEDATKTYLYKVIREAWSRNRTG